MTRQQGSRRRGNIVTRARNKLAVLAVIGVMGCGPCAPQHAMHPDASPSDIQTSAGPEDRGSEPPFHLDVPSGSPSERTCQGHPEIEEWSRERGLDPDFVRAVVLVESGFDGCAAAKVCREGYDGPGCFQPGPGRDECYEAGYDEMRDPSGTCDAHITNAPNSGDETPDWRWCGLGLMQTIEPPHTFWPAAENPHGRDGPYSDIYLTSGFGGAGLDTLDDAAGCAADTDPRGEFNPFDPDHSVCLGTLKLERGMRQARAIIRELHQSGMLNWSDDAEKDDIFAMYITAHLYAGTWNATASSMRPAGGVFPPCSAELATGECLTQEFHDAWIHGDGYCGSRTGLGDSARCSDGIPRQDPPDRCYGYQDILMFFQDCIQPFLAIRRDIGAEVLRRYYQIRDGCQDR